MTDIDRLREHPFVRGLSAAQVEALARSARLERLRAGVFVFREGGPANALYLVLGGRVVLEQHVPGQGALQVEDLTAGDMLGLSWLFPGGRWVLDARVAEEAELIVLDAAGVHALLDADPVLGLSIAKHVIQQLYQRLERVRLQRLDVYRGAR